MPEPHERLDRAMEARRLELDMTWTDLARAANVSPQALRSIRRGEYRPSKLTAKNLDRALHWPTGTVDEILDGADAPSTMDAAEGILDENERLAAEIRTLSDSGRQAVKAFIAAWKETAENPGPDGDSRR